MPRISLKDLSTKSPKDIDKDSVEQEMKKILEDLDELQNLLYAQSKFSILIVLQGMDASGKDGLIRDVFGQMNPQGVTVRSFKAPTEEELSHDFLWRIHKAAPAKGMIQVFNRSHYEDVLVTRVHRWINDDEAKKRMKAINDFEMLLHEHNNTYILKFYLHVSEEEQQERLNERIHDPRKQWKYNEKDFTEAALRPQYFEMYEDCFEYCNYFPWMIIPADQNWYKEYLVAKELHRLLKSLDMHYPGIKK
jgi:PPK2 family polyphosphate:nucleotide phosphotransferase